jgi:alpha-glucoside transport system substrate-binding protein|tara:strand:- start:209 stop:1471 length:1263 start_codon:yes stop_codon:yes gene_type:complete
LSKIVRYLFPIAFLFITFSFSFIAYDPAELTIIGPEFHDQDYFEEELNIISNKLNVKIKYKGVTDPESYLINNPDHNVSLAVIPNPQGVTNLADRGLISNLNSLRIDENLIQDIYSDHLVDLVSLSGDTYAGWLRLFPNSLIWYDISKISQYENINFQSFDSLVSETKKIADDGVTPWCSNSESSSSTGWIQTNWLEDVILSKYGPDIYDRWMNMDIQVSNVKIFSSIKVIGELLFYPNHTYGGSKSAYNYEFRNLPKIMLNPNNECFMSWSGHYFRYYIPDNYIYGEDYGVAKLPYINIENTVVGIGDSIVLVNNNEVSMKVISQILSKDFGQTWSSYRDSEYISANKRFEISNINNDLTKYEFEILHDALIHDLFRYDASEIMPRDFGSNSLWKFFNDYMQQGPSSVIKLLNELDKEI